jgi:fermentation-respiration switch protein FrsA (DUF1100 family)
MRGSDRNPLDQQQPKAGFSCPSHLEYDRIRTGGLEMADATPQAEARGNLAIRLLRSVPFRWCWRGRSVTRLAGAGCCLYVVAFLLLLALEDRLLFTGATFGRLWLEPPAGLAVRDLTLAADGNHIHAWFTTPPGWTPRRGAIVFSHGQGGNLSRIAGRASRWRDPFGRAVLLYDYPGYGKSSGRPSEAGCYAAGDAAIRWLAEEQHVPVGEIILVGESMGGAIATELATRYEVRLLILHGAFTSFPDMAQQRFPIFPGRYLVHNRMDNEARVGQIRCPVLLTHGTADAVVPFAQGERLFAAAHEPKRFLRLEGCGHASPCNEDFFEEVRSFLARTSLPTRP